MLLFLLPSISMTDAQPAFPLQSWSEDWRPDKFARFADSCRLSQCLHWAEWIARFRLMYGYIGSMMDGALGWKKHESCKKCLGREGKMQLFLRLFAKRIVHVVVVLPDHAEAFAKFSRKRAASAAWQVANTIFFDWLNVLNIAGAPSCLCSARFSRRRFKICVIELNSPVFSHGILCAFIYNTYIYIYYNMSKTHGLTSD